MIKIIIYIKPHYKGLKWNNREVMNYACEIKENPIKVSSPMCSERFMEMFFRTRFISHRNLAGIYVWPRFSSSPTDILKPTANATSIFVFFYWI